MLRHLRKVLLLTAVSHNPDAVRACILLAAIPSSNFGELNRSTRNKRYSTEDIRRQHDEEHGTVGINVRLAMDDLERLHLVLQPANGGGIDDPPLRIGEYLWTSLYATKAPPTATIPIADVERELRRILEIDLSNRVNETEARNEELAASVLGATVKPLVKWSNNMDQNESKGKQTNNQYLKETSYTNVRGTTILLKPNHPDTSSGASAASGEPNFGSAASPRLHDLIVSDCSDCHLYLLQPFEHATIANCSGCTIVVGATAGLLQFVDCERTNVTSAARRVLVCNSSDLQLCIFTPSPPLLVGDNRTCQFGPYNSYYEGLREDLMATGLAAAVVPENQSPYHGGRGSEYDAAWPPLQCASNKWKQPVEISKLEMPQIQPSGSGSPGSNSGTSSPPGADDKVNDATMCAPILLPVSEFHILFVPIETDLTRQRRQEPNENEEVGEKGNNVESQYCRLIAEVLQLSPFRLPVEYERRALVKVDRMRNIQQAVQKNLIPEHQIRFEEELNRGFRDWLVSSGNLRQVLDLVHLEKQTARA
jgi:hypothetical protein